MIFLLRNILFTKNVNLLKFRCAHDWVRPEGFDSGIQVYNCITRNKEPLILQNKNLIKWYTCGPTVYDSSHVGHASCYVKLDIIQKILKNYFNYNLLTVMNITDIDDKIINKANATKTSYENISSKFEKEFWADLKDLDVAEPDIVVRVTENINLVIDFISKLEKDGNAYKASDNSVYFNVESCKTYGKLQNIGKEELESKPNKAKKSPLDFALWKNSKAGEPFWSSPWGNGRPGWHIECSALASHILGSSIDVHGGGIDLRFPHHENEEAQCCSYHETPQWVNYWLHAGHLRKKDSEKMSKSLGNTISIQEMLRSTSPESFRMACAMSSYRSIMEYSEELLETAKNNLKTYKNFMDSCEAYKKGLLKGSVNGNSLLETLSKSSGDIHTAICDDFDTPRVMKTLNELVSVSNSMLYAAPAPQTEKALGSIISVQNVVKRVLNVLGIDLDVKSAKSEEFDQILDLLTNFRQNLRIIGLANKNRDVLNLCDGLRDNLKKGGS